MYPRGIHAVASSDPDRLAIVCADQRLTYRDLDAGINGVANALAARGVARGDRVAVMLRNRPELYMAWNGAARLGAIVVPVSYRLTSDEVAYLVADSGARAFIHEGPAALAEIVGALEHRPSCLDVGEPTLWSERARPPIDDFLGTSVTLMNYTSGTTGRPKGIQRPAPEPSPEPVRPASLDLWGFGPDDVHLVCGPAYHTAPGHYGQMHLNEGALIVMMNPFDADECLRLIERERVTNTHMVPANFIRILESDWSRYDLSSIRKIIHGAAPCPLNVKRRILDVFPPGTVWEYYGMSEGMGSVISPEEWVDKPGSVGRPFPGLSIAIVSDDGTECAPGEVGHIYVSSQTPQRFRYHNAPEKTDAAWRGEKFTVGDLGWLDEDGYLYIADRRVDLVISNGVNIYPAEIEQALADHPAVVDAAVFGLPDDRTGQRVHAVIEVRPGAPCDEASILDHLRGRLADFKLPRQVEFVDELPREPNGKVLKHRLRDERVGAVTSRTS